MIPSLNGLRAFSILLVIFSHLMVVDSFPGFLKTFLEPIANGEIGVRLFFVISGFLITWLLIKEKEKTGRINIKKFYIRRLLRIFPVFYFYILFVFLVSRVTGNAIRYEVFITSFLYLQNFGFGGYHWLLSHSWTLAVEEQFYLIWPWIARQTSNKLPILISLLVLVIGLLSRIIAYKFPSLSNYLLLPFLMHIDFLYGGCLLAFIIAYKQEWYKRQIAKIRGWILPVGLFFVFIFGYYEFDPRLDRLVLPIAGTYMTIYFVILIGWVTNKSNSNSTVYKLLNNSILNRIGILSYGLYVWQQFFLVPIYNSYSEYWWTQFPQNILLLIVAVQFSYYIIEKPFLQIKKRFR